MIKKLSALLAGLIVATSMVGLKASAAVEKMAVDHIDRNVFVEYINTPGYDPEHTRPGDELIIPLQWEGFRDANDDIIDWGREPKYGPSVLQLKRSQVSPKLVVVKGSKFIRDISLVDFTPTRRNKTYSAIRVRFIEDMVSTEEFAYQFQVQFYIGHKANRLIDETFSGRISNEIYDAYNKDYIYTGDGTVVKSHNAINGLEFDTGNSLIANIDSNTNQKYYAISKAYDYMGDEIEKEYPEIKTIYDLKTIGVKGLSTSVKFKGHTPQDSLYVYDVNGKYLGKSHEEIPYSNRYYLTSKEVEMNVELLNKSLPKGVQPEDDKYVPAALKDFQEGIEKANKLPEAPKEVKEIK